MCCSYGFGGPFDLRITQAALRFGLPRPPASPPSLANALRCSGESFSIRIFAPIFPCWLNHFKTSGGSFFFTLAYPLK
jgi:hypothetical protein